MQEEKFFISKKKTDEIELHKTEYPQLRVLLINVICNIKHLFNITLKTATY